jgi:hypothetical protein
MAPLQVEPKGGGMRADCSPIQRRKRNYSCKADQGVLRLDRFHDPECLCERALIGVESLEFSLRRTANRHPKRSSALDEGYIRCVVNVSGAPAQERPGELEEGAEAGQSVISIG